MKSCAGAENPFTVKAAKFILIFGRRFVLPKYTLLISYNITKEPAVTLKISIVLELHEVRTADSAANLM